MADRMLVRKAIEVEHYPVDAATVIEVGDAVYFDGTANEVFPAADFTWSVDLATTQALFDSVFAGVALSRSLAGESKDVRIATKGEAEFDCDSASFNPDEFVGLDESTILLENQKVATVANAGLAIGKPSKVQASVTKCFFIFRSANTGPKID